MLVLAASGAVDVGASGVVAAAVGAGAGVAVGCGVASASIDCSTEREPVKAGSERASASNIKSAAEMMVTFARIDCVPRGPKAVLDTELVKSAPHPPSPAAIAP